MFHPFSVVFCQIFITSLQKSSLTLKDEQKLCGKVICTDWNIGSVKSPCLCCARLWICCPQPAQEWNWETPAQSIHPWSRNNKSWLFPGVCFPSAGLSLLPWLHLSSDFLRALTLGRHQHNLNSFSNIVCVAGTAGLG